MFRGDLAHTGVYGSAAPKNISHILWQFKTGGRIFSSPVVADGIVYVGSDDHSLHAIDARKGREIWKFQTEANVNSTPAVANGSVYVLSRKTDDIMNTSVGTDPTLALKTRRGTGFYKVPSLRGLWYRNAFGHGGQAATLEEWFDPARLEDGYVPRGFHLGPGPIEGHEKGLDLTLDEKQDLIAFLKTL